MNLPFNIPNDPWLLIFYFWEQIGNSPYFKIGAIVFGAFLFLFLFALVRKHIFQLSMRGAVFGFIAGILLMVILDLVIIFGMADKAKVVKLTKGENRQEVVQEIVISGMTSLGDILGVQTAATPKITKKTTKAEDVLNAYWNLPQEDAKRFKELLCTKD